MIPRTIASVAAAVCLLFASAPRAANRTPEELAHDLQRKYDSIRDFSADFVHTYQGGVLKKRLTESGHLIVKKPGKMRWEYTAPEKKLFVSDGVKIYSYIPQDRQVIVGTVPREDRAPTAALFLAGKGNITRDYTPSFGEVPQGSGGAQALKLVPKTGQSDYDWLLVVVDSSLSIRGLATADDQGGQSTFTFANLKENVGTPDKEFTFKIPRGVDVVTDASR